MRDELWQDATDVLAPLIGDETSAATRCLYGKALWGLARRADNDSNEREILEKVVAQLRFALSATSDVPSQLRSDVLALLGTSLRALGRRSEAAECFAIALRYFPNVQLSHELAATYLEDDATKQAEHVLRGLQQTDHDALTLALLARCALDRGDRSGSSQAAVDAVRLLADGTSGCSDRVQALIHLTAVAASLASADLARQIDSLISPASDDFRLRLLRARLAEIDGDHRLTNHEYQAALALWPTAGIACEFAAYCRRTGKHGEAIAILEPHKAQLSDDALRLYVQSACSAGEYVSAHDAVEALWNAGNRDLWLVRARAHIADYRDDVTALIETLGEWVALAPSDAEPAGYLAFSLVRAGREDEALPLLARLRTEYATTATVKLRIAELHVRVRLGPDAMELAWRALRESPGEPLIQRGYLSLATGWIATAEYSSDPDVAGPGVAVRWRSEDGIERTILIGSEQAAKTDFDEVAPDHAFALAVSGRKKGDSFVLQPGSAFEKRATITDLLPKYAYGFQWVTDKLQADPTNPMIQSFSVVDDDGMTSLERFERIVREKARRQNQPVDLYSQRCLPLGFVAEALSESLVDAYARISGDATRKLFVEFSSPGDHTKAVEACSAPSIVLTRTALLTLTTVDRLPLLEQLNGKLLITQALLDDLAQERLELVNLAMRGGSSLGLVDDRLAMNTVSSDEGRRRLESHDAVVRWLRDHSEVCPLPLTAMPEHIGAWESVGTESFAACRLAAARDAVLYADDLGLRQMAHAGMQVQGFSTYALLCSALGSDRISRSDFRTAVVELLHLNHNFVPINASILIAAFERSGYRLDKGVQQVIKQLRGSHCELAGAAHVAAECLRDLALRESLVDSHVALSDAVLEAAFLDREAAPVLAAIRAELTSACRLLPLHLESLCRKLDGFHRRRAGEPMIRT